MTIMIIMMIMTIMENMWLSQMKKLTIFCFITDMYHHHGTETEHSNNKIIIHQYINYYQISLRYHEINRHIQHHHLQDNQAKLHKMYVCLCSSVEFSPISSIVLRQKSQRKASLKRWVLSPARNWLWLMDGERRWSGSEFQTTGAAMKKLHLPSLVVLVRGTNRSPRSAERRPGRPEL